MTQRQRLKALVATARGQGVRANDFCFAVEGELVHVGFVCDSDTHDADGPCGCGRSLSGVTSGFATTTVRVAAYAGNRANYIAELARSLTAAGYGAAAAAVAQEADALLAVAARFPLDTVLEWRLGVAAPRTLEVSDRPAEEDA
jgi:hypothetical protein